MVASNAADKGILLCGSGIGISIAANKVKGIRAALCTSPEHAMMSRKHNDANILALGSRMTNYELIEEIIDVWLNTSFEGGRHLDRINMIEI
jgi:ribose 5-phosphate isomerase B